MFCGSLLCIALLIAAQSPAAGTYDPDLSNVSNRLYDALLVRKFHDRMLGFDALDPLLGPDSEYLLLPPAYDRAIAVLDEFLKSGPGSLSDSKRAVLQHDLWAVFDWTTENFTHPEERNALRLRLAHAIRS